MTWLARIADRTVPRCVARLLAVISILLPAAVCGADPAR